MTAACIACYLAEIVIIAMCGGAGLWLLTNTEHSTAGGWCIAFALGTVVFWTCA